MLLHSLLRRRSVLVALAATPTLLLLLCYSQALFAWLWPRGNFERITGYALPPGVRVVRFESRLCDNLFKICYYWTLEAPPGTTFSGPRGSRVRSAFDNVDGYLTEALSVLEPSTGREAVPQRYQFHGHGGRQQFLFLHRDGTRCYYMIGTFSD